MPYSCRTRAYSCRTRAVLAPIFSKVDIMHENQGSHEKTSFFVKKVMKNMKKCENREKLKKKKKTHKSLVLLHVCAKVTISTKQAQYPPHWKSDPIVPS